MNTRIKVLHLSSEYTWRGGEQQLAYLIEEQLKNPLLEVHVACRSNSAFERHCAEKDIKHFSADFTNSLDFNTAKKVKTYCKQEDIDLVHSHSSKSHGIAVISGVLGNKAKQVLHRRVDFKIKTNWITRFKYNYGKIKKIICVSHKIEEVMHEAIKDGNKLTTIHSGIDRHKFSKTRNSKYFRQAYGIPGFQLLIGNTSALSPQKDYFTFLDTVDILLNKGLQAKFLIIGEGALRERIEAYIKEKKLENDVIMTGFMPDLKDHLHELDVFLMTSEAEGLGTSIIDAFACEVPVVATAAGGIPELVINHNTGMLCPPKNPEGLAKAVLDVNRDVALRKKQIGRAHV